MKLITILMMIGLLLLTPFTIMGVTAGPPDAEIPAAHSVYRVNGSSRTAYVRRQKRLLSLEDIVNFHPDASLDETTGRIKSTLPSSSVNKVQGCMSPLAYAYRKLIKTCEPSLSKTEIRKLVRPLFPSRSQIKRLARRTRCTRDTVLSGFEIRQNALLSTLRAWTFAGPNAQQAALKDRLGAEKNKLTKRLKALKGYKSLSDKRELHQQLPEYVYQSETDAIEKTEANASKVYEVLTPLTELVSKEQALEIAKVFPKAKAVSIEGKDSTKFLRWVSIQRSEHVNSLQAIISNKREAEEAAWQTSELVVNHKLDERTTIHYRLQKIEWIDDNIHKTYVAAPSIAIAEDAFSYSAEPWRDETSAKEFLSTVFINFMIEKEWAFFTDPAVVLPAKSSPEDFGVALSSQYEEGIPAVTILRKAASPYNNKSMMKQTIKAIKGLNIYAGLSLYSETRDDNNRCLNKKELVTQWLDSNLVLEAPSGVEKQLGIAWNQEIGEAKNYTNKYKGKNILFAPTKEESKKTKTQLAFDKLRARMGF
jgi:hypothetical protein